MPVPNAFALPAGQIFITTGMLDLGLDDDMLANVLGHEIGHVINEHYLKMQRRATLMNVLGNLLVAGVVIGESQRKTPTAQAPYDPRVGYDNGGGNLVQGAAAASLVVSELLLRSYSRDNEDEADKEGQRLAGAAGLQPGGRSAAMGEDEQPRRRSSRSMATGRPTLRRPARALRRSPQGHLVGGDQEAGRRFS